MNFVFISSDRSLEPFKVNHEDQEWCFPNEKHRLVCKEFLDQDHRMFELWEPDSPISQDVYSWENETCRFFHGYLLDSSFSPEDRLHLDPAKCYYGVYMHGFISPSDCWFATDELGLSPLYYSKTDHELLIGNNPHLIAYYRIKLGYKLEVEPTLPIQHTLGITNESNVTGYADIYRVDPWRYLTMDFQNNLSLPSKDRIYFEGDYKQAVASCIEEFQTGMRAIDDKYATITSQLTGGLDSRLVLTFILDAGISDKVTFTTGGSPQNPDRIAAERLAKHYGLKHNVFPRTVKKIEQSELDALVQETCMRNAMESALVRVYGYGKPTSHTFLNGCGAVFAKSLNYTPSFKAFMEKKFNDPVNYNALTNEQIDYGWYCLGYANQDKLYLTEEGLNQSKSYRDYIMRFNYQRFPENMNYADSFSAYRYRTHNASFSTMNNNCIFLYSPVVLEASRLLSPELRQEGKLYFDMMFEVNDEICYFPLENRVYNPIVYADKPLDVQSRLASVPAETGSIVSEVQENLFDNLLPIMKESLLDILPSSVFDFIDREHTQKMLAGDQPFGKPVFPLVNLYGIAKWYEIVAKLNDEIQPDPSFAKTNQSKKKSRTGFFRRLVTPSDSH